MEVSECGFLGTRTHSRLCAFTHRISLVNGMDDPFASWDKKKFCISVVLPFLDVMDLRGF